MVSQTDKDFESLCHECGDDLTESDGVYIDKGVRLCRKCFILSMEKEIGYELPKMR